MAAWAANEGAIRLAVFGGVLVLMAALEFVLPRKPRVQTRSGRWFTNLSLVVVDSIALRVAVPVLAVAMANVASERGWGLFAMIDAPFWLEVVAAMIILDLMIYAQHVATHKIPFLWALHKVHHADRDLDATSGVRFHPIEIVLSMFYKLACVVVIGPPAVAVFLFEVILNASAIFNHANVRLPLAVDRVLRLFIVTPDMHRVHHSTVRRETDSNYGFSISLWDRVFGTYRAQPEAGHDAMTLGLPDHQSDKPSRLLFSLLLPFENIGRKARHTGEKVAKG